MNVKSVARPWWLLIAITSVGTAASLLLSVASLIVALQARQASQPSLAFDFPKSLAVHARQCTDAAQNNQLFTQFDIEYVLTVTNSGGRSTNLLHAALTSGANNDIPWPLALTDGPTAQGTIIDGGQATFVLPPAPIASGLSKKIVVNGRIRVNASEASQLATGSAISSGKSMRLELVFSTGEKRIVNLPYAVKDETPSGQSSPCVNAGDFHYQIDQL